MASLNPFSRDFFTARECEICLMVMKGIHTVDMPDHSTMKYETIKTHLKNIFQKTHTDCILQLALWLVLHNWEISMEIN